MSNGGNNNLIAPYGNEMRNLPMNPPSSSNVLKRKVQKINTAGIAGSNPMSA
jgi:hypothetical protein